MAKIDVALCITDLDIGGAERCLTQLATRIDRRRFTPVVYCLAARPEREEASCVPALERAGIEVHCLGANGLWQFPAIIAKLRRLLLSQKPQIVQTFLFHANIVGRIAARRAGVKAVVSAIRVAERASRWHLWLDRLTQGSVDRYVCVSRSVADFSITAGALPMEKIVTIPNGIDLGEYPAQAADLPSLGIPTGRRLIAFVGRLERQKGVDWLIAAAPPWIGQVPSDCDLLIVGDGPLRGRLESACRAKAISSRVHFVGWQADVPRILAASEILVLPSKWEGMPNVVLEAMASHLPVVATDVEGVRELLGAADDEQTVAYGDTQSLVTKLVKHLTNRDAAAALGEKNRRRAEENFDIHRMVRAYEDLWESLATG